MNLTRFRLIGHSEIAWHIACSADAATSSTDFTSDVSSRKERAR